MTVGILDDILSSMSLFPNYSDMSWNSHLLGGRGKVSELSCASCGGRLGEGPHTSMSILLS